jgi:hypothetical protein
MGRMARTGLMIMMDDEDNDDDEDKGRLTRKSLRGRFMLVVGWGLEDYYYYYYWGRERALDMRIRVVPA